MAKTSIRIITYENVNFSVRYSFPSALAGKQMPCRGLVTPISPDNGQLITKKQLGRSESETIVDRPVYGKNPADIEKQRITPVLQQLLVEMQAAGLVREEQPHGQGHDLADIANEFRETFFDLHRRSWSNSTINSYNGQYKILCGELKGIVAEELTAEAYIDLQCKICRNALATTRIRSEWTPGAEAPPSAQKRLNLLYELILDLKRVSGYDIPVVPSRYNGKPSHDALLFARTDSARSLPADVLRAVSQNPELQGQTALLLDTGLRISENTGLLNGSLHCINGSQGELYYISVTGQFDTGRNKHRTEFPKTDPSYRIIPVSVDLGRKLAEEVHSAAKKQKDVSLLLMCDQASDGQASTYQDHISKLIPELLRDPDTFAKIAKERAYTFDDKRQDESLRSMLTCHAFRRNYCTWMYCHGIPTQEIYQQMGHALKTQSKRSTYKGKPPADIYAVCLQKYVRTSLYSPSHTLYYTAGDKYTHSEVPACSIDLSLPPNSCYRVIIEDTEPNNNITVAGEEIALTIVYHEVQPSASKASEFLVRDELLTIQSKNFPFRAK